MLNLISTDPHDEQPDPNRPTRRATWPEYEGLFCAMGYWSTRRGYRGI